MIVEFRLLGDISASVDGRLVNVGHARQKIVFSAFLVQPNQLITTNALIDHVWADRLPQRARDALYSYIARLNRELSSADLRISRRSGGYVLNVDPGCVDLHRFRQSVARARRIMGEGDAELALSLLQEALDLWQGRPFGACDTPRLERLRTGLERERLAAELDRNDLALALGRHVALMGELVAAAVAQPLDERVVGQLMLALYRSGRQAEAQSLYRDTRERLVDQLGTEPGRELQDLYVQMIGADPALRLKPTADAFAEQQTKAAARLDLVVYRTPSNRLNRPAALVGRHEVVRRVNAMLDEGRSVLLYGLAGMGKTAIAATVADERLGTAGRPYVWLRVGDADPERVFDALVRRLGTADDTVTIEAMTGDARLLAVQELLERSGAALLVLDDVWNGRALYEVLRAVPDSLPALVTSRTKFGLENQVEVGDLPGDEAVRLLSLHAGAPGMWSRSAAELCRLLGNHPYAVEIAGRHLRQYGMDPGALLAQIATTPHDLTMPVGLAPADRESMKRLLDRSYEAMDDSDSRLVFRAFGTLTFAGASAPLLAALTGLDTARTQVALNALADLSLVRRRQGSALHELHDLTFSYCRALAVAGPERPRTTVDAVRRFTTAHGGNLDLIEADLDNLIAAADEARYSNEPACIDIVSAIAMGGYLDDRGHTPNLLRLLDEVIDRVRAQHRPDDLLHQLLGKRGNAYVHQGRLTEAVAAYEQALDLAPNASRRAILLAVLGKTLAGMGEHDRAENVLKMAYETAETQEDPSVRLRILEQHSHAAHQRKDFHLVRELTLRGVDESRRLGARATEAIFLNNLGIAELQIGLGIAVQRHLEAERIARELNDLDILVLTQHNLGIDWQAAEDPDRAAHHLREALALYERLGYTQEEQKLRTFMERFGHHPTAGPPGGTT
jgi:DNA-binding SARP family transcriptional activator